MYPWFTEGFEKNEEIEIEEEYPKVIITFEEYKKLKEIKNNFDNMLDKYKKDIHEQKKYEISLLQERSIKNFNDYFDKVDEIKDLEKN